MRVLEVLIKRFLIRSDQDDEQLGAEPSLASARARAFEAGFRSARMMAAKLVLETHQVRKDLISHAIDKIGEEEAKDY